MVALDIVMITGFRPHELEKCLQSLCAAIEFSKIPVRVFIGMNGVSEDQVAPLRATLEAAQRNCRGAIVARWFPREKLGAARNLVLKETRAEWIFFCDDDVEVPLGIFTDWRELAQSHPNIEVFGGPNITPETAADFDRFQGEVLGSLLGAGPFRRRYSSSTSEGPATSASLTLCNLFVRRPRGSEADFLFSPDVRGGEELIFLENLAHRFYWSPKLFVLHKRRPDLAAFYRQCVKYGVGRSHANPISVCVGLIAVVLGGIFLGHRLGLLFFGYVFFAYVFLVVTNSLWLRLKVRARGAFMMLIQTHFALHGGYVAGLVKGVFPSSKKLGSLRE